MDLSIGALKDPELMGGSLGTERDCPIETFLKVQLQFMEQIFQKKPLMCLGG